MSNVDNVPVPQEFKKLFDAQPNLIDCRDWMTRKGLEAVAKSSKILTIQEIGEINSPFLK